MAPATASAVNLAGQVASKGNFVFLAFEMSFVITNFISGCEQSLSPPHWGAQLQVKLLFYPGGVPRQLRSSGHGLLLGQLLCSATSFASRMALTPVIGPMFSGKSSFLLNWASFRQKTFTFKHKFDDRYVQDVFTHTGSVKSCNFLASSFANAFQAFLAFAGNNETRLLDEAWYKRTEFPNLSPGLRFMNWL